MSDTPVDSRSGDGTRADRSPLTAVGNTALGAGVVGLLVATGDWGNTMIAAGHWVAPENALEAMWATALAPIFHLCGLIVINRLRKLEEKTRE